jgi:hypothetical protein
MNVLCYLPWLLGQCYMQDWTYWLLGSPRKQGEHRINLGDFYNLKCQVVLAGFFTCKFANVNESKIGTILITSFINSYLKISVNSPSMVNI